MHTTAYDMYLCSFIGRPKSGRSNENIAAVDAIVTETPQKSIRSISNDSGIGHESVRRILKKDLDYKPYKIPVVQMLKEEDFGARLEACTVMINKLENDPEMKKHILMTDECIFTLDNTLSPSHSRYWSPTKPRAVQQRPMQPSRLHVWCGLTAEHVFGPYYFDGSVTADTYQTMLRDHLLPDLRRKRMMRIVVFQQDGAPAHTAHTTIELLQRTFGDQIISRNCEFRWPARSPDLTPPDFFLWGTLKLRIKARKPKTITELKEFLQEEVAEINNNKALLASVFDNFEKRLRLCVQSGGSHVLL